MTLLQTTRRLLLLAIFLIVPSLARAQGGQPTLIHSSPEPLPNCTPAVTGQLQPQIWDTTAQQMKTCTAPNTWSQMGGPGGGFYQTIQVNGSAQSQQLTSNYVAGANMTINASTVGGVTTLTFISTNTAATAFSAITAATNNNAGAFIATGNSWDFSGATSLKAPTVGLILPGSVSGTETILPVGTTLGSVTISIPDITSTVLVNAGPNTGASSMTLNLSGLTGANAFQVPVLGGCTAGAGGVVCDDTHNTHVRTNGADSLAGAFASLPGSTNLCLEETLVGGSVILSPQTFPCDPGFIAAAAQWSVGVYTGAGVSSTLGGVGNGYSGQVFVATTSAAPSFVSAGLPGRLVSTNSDNILCDNVGVSTLDRAGTVQYTFAGAVAVGMPSAAGAGCAPHFLTAPYVTGAGAAVTITPTTSTINGLASIVLGQNSWAVISSPDNVNYIARMANYVKAGTGLTSVFNADGSTTLNTSASGGTVTNPNGNFTQCWPLYAFNGTVGAFSSFDGCDVTAYGVDITGATDAAPAFRNAIAALPVAGGTLNVPANANVRFDSTVILTPGTRIVCGGKPGWKASETVEGVHFQTAQPIDIFQIGVIGASSVQNPGVQIEDCAFRDNSAGKNTALMAITILNTSRSTFRNLNFEDFNRPSVATPAAPAIAGSGAGATSFWVRISCINDAMGETVWGAEQTLASNTNPLTVTAPTSAGCPAPSSGYRVWATTTGTNVEVLQAAAGCTLNASGTGCGLNNNWSGTVNNAGNAQLPYDTSAGAGAHTDANGGANGTLTDASYNEWEQIYCGNTQECLQFNGGSQFLHGGGELVGGVYDILNQNNGFVSIVGGPSLEATNNAGFRMLIASSTSPTSVIGSKFEGSVVTPNNITCAEVNSSRNSFLGNSWTKCNVIVQENASSNSNHYDFMNAISNGTTHYTGTKNTDLIDDNNQNGGGYSQIGFLNVPVALEIPISAGFTANATSMFGYDSTAKNVHQLCNGADCLSVGEAAALTANVIPKQSSSTLSLIVASLLSDNGTTLSYTGTGGIASPSLATGTTPPACTAGTAGFWCATEGTAPTNVAGASAIYPDSTAHEYLAFTNGATSNPGMLVRSQPSPIHQTAKTAAISTATLCAASAGACNVAGQYHVHFDFIETGTACGTPATGGVTFLLTWTDTNATTHSAVSLGMDDASAINAVSQTFHFQTTLAAAWASGDFNISTNGSVIQYATGYTACGVGTGTYQLDAAVTRLQ